MTAHRFWGQPGASEHMNWKPHERPVRVKHSEAVSGASLSWYGTIYFQSLPLKNQSYLLRGYEWTRQWHLHNSVSLLTF